MGWARRYAIAPATNHQQKGLTVLTGIAGLVAVGLTVLALVRPQELKLLVDVLRGRSGLTADYTLFGFDGEATRNNTAESRITAANVGGLHLLWRGRLPAIADSTPVLLHGLSFPDGTERSVLYLTTKPGGLVALDADSGALLWTRSYGTSDPNKFTTSTPYADAASGFVYSYGMDGRVHKYDAITGKEMRGSVWPVQVTTMPLSEKVSSALNAANGYLYVPTASYGGDAPPYQGHLVTINLASGATHVFNTICSDYTHLLAPGECRDNEAGIWARPGVVVDPQTRDVWLATANGPYTADVGGYDWGDSVLRLSPDGAHLLDSYTPRGQDALYMQDQDLGSSAPALLPELPRSSTPYLLVQAGKEGVLRLLNRQNLSGQGGPGHMGGELQTLDAPGHCPTLAQPAIWTDPTRGTVWVFVASQCAIGGYQVEASQGVAQLRLRWSMPVGATSPLLANGVLFAATTGDKTILALDPESGRQLWSSKAKGVGGSIGYTHWENPIVVNGRLYCTDEDGDIVAYGT